MGENNTYRKRALEELEKALDRGEVDEDAVPLLEAINALPSYATTSSCSGRIQIIEVKDLGRKEGSIQLARFHRWPGEDAIVKKVEGWRGKGLLILQCQSPIFHVRCRDLRAAVALVNLSRECGFKYSSLRSLKFDRHGRVLEFSTVVELLTPNRMDMPLGSEGKLYVDVNSLRRTLPIFSRCLKKGKSALTKLTDSVSRLSTKS